LCSLSSNSFVVDELLSGKIQEEVNETIISKLREIGEMVRNRSLPIDRFMITKSLTKSPHLYSDAGAQPHVKVALEMIAQGRHVAVGDTIPYVICSGTGSLAEKAHHPFSVQVVEGTLQIDSDWYLSHQLFPPISRLCEPIEGMHQALIAEALGLDASRFVESTRMHTSQEDLFALDVYDYQDDEAFKDLDKLEITCRHCGQKSQFHGLCTGAVDKVLINGLRCPTPSCPGFVRGSDDIPRIVKSVSLLIRRSVSKYFQRIYRCDDVECPLRFGTKRVPKMTSYCFRAACSGKLTPEVCS
jgi:DNA polymerase alpha subunit A